MKVLFTTDTIGGVWNFSLALARALPFEVHLATMGRKLTPAQRLEVANLPFHESEFPLEWMPDAWAGVDRAGEWLLQLEHEVNPELIHHNTLSAAHLPFRAPSIVTMHSCVLSWWEAVKSESAPFEWDEYRRRVRRSLRAAAEVAAPTRAMLDAARRLYGIAGHVIPNFAPPCRSACAKEPLVFVAGRMWDEAKNLAALQETAQGLSWPVYIAGEGGPLGVLDREEIDRWYARASIYAWPAKYEPFGLSVLEAAQHGCALVLGDVPSLRENWNGAAHFVRNTGELSSAIEELIANPELLASLAYRAQERARRFTESVTVNAYSALYSRVLSGALCAS